MLIPDISIPNSYSLVDLLADIGNLFLFQPQVPGANINGRYVPLNISIPEAPEDIGCLGLTLASTGAPDEATPVVQAAASLFNQVFGPALGHGGCNVADYEKDGGQAKVVSSNEDINGGSGSGITHFGEYDSQTEKPKGLSSGQAIKRGLKNSAKFRKEEVV